MNTGNSSLQVAQLCAKSPYYAAPVCRQSGFVLDFSFSIGLISTFYYYNIPCFFYSKLLTYNYLIQTLKPF